MLLLLGGSAIGLLVAEGALRTMAPVHYYAHPPHYTTTLRPMPESMPGIHGESRFTVNSQGFRGREPSPVDTVRIIALGGSTTICTYLDDAETWPALLEARLNASNGTSRVWIGNAGRSGNATPHHLLQAQRLLPWLPGTDIVLVLVGINDLGRRLAADEPAPSPAPSLASPAEHDRLVHMAFGVYPMSAFQQPWKRTETWRLLRQLRWNLAGMSYLEGDGGELNLRLREHRQHATVIRETLPDLTPALAQYRQNLNALIDRLQELYVRPVLLTQPTIWRADLEPAELALLSGGRVGRKVLSEPGEYYAIAALADGMAAFNRTLLEVARARDIEAIDLAAAIPKTAAMFYDDGHFTEAGAQRVAEVIAEHFPETSDRMNGLKLAH